MNLKPTIQAMFIVRAQDFPTGGCAAMLEPSKIPWPKTMFQRDTSQFLDFIS